MNKCRLRSLCLAIGLLFVPVLAQASVTIPDMAQLRAGKAESNLYPSFLQSTFSLQDAQTGQQVLVAATRCGYFAAAGGLSFDDTITELVLNNQQTGYLAVFQKIDGQGIAVVRDNQTGKYHVSGVVGGVYKGKLCDAYDLNTGLISACSDEQRPPLPQQYAEKYVSSAVGICSGQVRAIGESAQAQLPPAPRPEETRLYIDTLKRNFVELGR